MPLNISVFEASKLVSTKTLLLKHYYRRQGHFVIFPVIFPLFRGWGKGGKFSNFLLFFSIFLVGGGAWACKGQA